MEIRDLIITPLLLLIVFTFAWWIRNKISDTATRRYFIPGLSVKILGAISLGLIYQFYYKGGDTFNYFERGSKYIWEAFKDSPFKAFQLIFAQGEYHAETYEYASQIVYYRDLPSYFVVRVAGIFDILTLHTYSATAVLFAIFSFSGLWAMYQALHKLYPKLHLQLAIAIFFVPSVFFWGSGILKDTLTLGALGWSTYAFINIFIHRKNLFISALIMALSFWLIYIVKIYILLCLIPALLIWLYLIYLQKLRSLVLKVMILPFTLTLIMAGGYYAIKTIGEENKRYNLTNLSYTAESTARWLSYVSEREEGSGYTLGDFDFSIAGMIRKTPQAIWVTLFRPYLWEVNNPVMFFSAIESLCFFLFTLYVIFNSLINRRLRLLYTHPIIFFTLLYSISFSFAIGISTYNFGTLVRYKIPMIPFYLIGLFVLLYYSKRRRKFKELDLREK